MRTRICGSDAGHTRARPGLCWELDSRWEVTYAWKSSSATGSERDDRSLDKETP